MVKNMCAFFILGLVMCNELACAGAEPDNLVNSLDAHDCRQQWFSGRKACWNNDVCKGSTMDDLNNCQICMDGVNTAFTYCT